ncbi:MAG: YIP1 family protein [Acidobacteriota bacterium]
MSFEPSSLESDGQVGVRPGLPWERRDDLGLAVGLTRTVVQVLFSPVMAFRSMRQSGGWADPMIFALVVGTVSIWIGQFWGMLVRSLLAAGTGLGTAEAAARNAVEVWFALVAPLIVVVTIALGAGVAHLLLMLFGGAPRQFETTVRVFSYSWAVNLFNVLPICGAFIAVFWGLVVQIIGLHHAQEVPMGRAAAAVLIPVLLSCFCFFLLLVLVGISSILLGGAQP